ncbi:carboxylesterase family protein [Pseudochryseolinea flava]|uniref:Dienelactone hydrolase domain-containing protein n=1 Tax=Pseudochryseolinea flava TaxID=2059302 RepID=A0A364XVF3_9BACT|nr:dienelactone hydrolase family protein [Pseudochryseolinea flava]RAV97936.1 hypothetical protein DQQ10_26045 [Pseudochryseolinea flava]
MLTLRKAMALFFAASVLGTLAGCGGSDSDADPTPSGGTDTELSALPKDTGGQHVAQVLGSTQASLGFYVYLPSGYTGGSASYPLLVFLHGKSERGDGTSTKAVLDKVLANGPPKLIKGGTWNPKYPMIVVSPQFHGTTGSANNWGGGDPSHLKNFIKFMVDNYRVNPKRIYLTGMSHGGNGVYDYLSLEDDATGYIAAAAPVAAYGAKKGFNKANDTPIWSFVGDQDESNFESTLNYVNEYNAQLPKPAVKARLSVFKDAGHDVWTRTYSGSGIGTASSEYDAFDKSVYDWMFQYKRKD